MTTSTAYCPRCGKPADPGHRFCSSCGEDITGEQGGAQTAILSMADLEATMLELVRHETVGEFEVLKELGRGGMAMVYLAHDISLNRKVAVKVMSPSLVQDKGMAERFIREAQTAASLSHPNIIPVYAVKQTKQVSFFVMKFITGTPLDSLMESTGPMPIKMVQTVLTQVAAGLGYGHKRGIVHRDVKPGNIMIDEEGWAIVTDFGIAKVESASGLTQTGAAIGTPTYMSPEQCSAGEVDGASDQYSLGILAYEMLTGRKPFEGDSVMQIMFAHVNEPPPPFADERSDCPPELHDAVMRMLEKKKENRFPALEDMISAIGGAPLSHDDPVRQELITLATQGIDASILQTRTPQSPVPSTSAQTSAQRAEAAAKSGVRPSAKTVMTAEATPPASAPTVVGQAEPPKKKKKTGVILAVVGTVAAAGVAAVFVLPGLAGGGDAPPPAPTGANTATPGPAAPTGNPAVRQVTLSSAVNAMVVGDSTVLTVTAADSAGNTIASPDVEFSSGDETRAVVSPSGVVTALASGTVSFTARVGEQSAVTQVTIDPAATATPTPSRPATPSRVAVAAVDVSPASQSVVVGDELRLTATPRAANRNALNGRNVQWRSDNPSVARVAGGVVTAVSPGNAVISAVSEGQTGTARIEVTDVPVSGVSVVAPRSVMTEGETLQLRATITGANGQGLTGRDVEWNSSNSAIATVDRSGLVTGVTPGMVTIAAASEMVTGRVQITIEAAAVTPEPPPTPPANPRDEIAAVIAAYARALESEDIGAVRQVYPDISSAEADGWRTAWDSWNALRVTLNIDDINITGNGAQVQASGTYVYQQRRQESLPVDVQISLARRAGGWVITAIR